MNRSQAARIAALTRWSQEDPQNQARKGQAGLLRRFEREVDPKGELTPTERQRRAYAAYRAHMQRLAKLSAERRAA